MTAPPMWRRPATLAVAIVALLVVAMVATRLPLLNSGEMDWDEGVYWLSMRSMHAGNPLFAAVFSSQPPAFLMVTEPPWVLFGGSIVAGRAVMLAWGAVAVVAGGVAAWRLAGMVAGVTAATLLAIDPAMLRGSMVLQADGPATALGVVGLAFAATAVTTRRPRLRVALAALAGAAAAAGVLTKLFDVGVLPPVAAALLLVPGRWRLIASAAAGGVLAAAAILLPIHGAWGAVWQQSVGLHLNTQQVTYGITLPTALTARWEFVVAGGLGAVAGWWRHRRLVIVGVAWAAGATAALAVTHPLWAHHEVLMSPALALLGGAGVSGLADAVRRRRPIDGRVLAAAGVLAVIAVEAWYLPRARSITHPSPNLTRIAAVIDANTRPGTEVLGDEQFAQALAGRLPPPGFVDTSLTRLQSEANAARELEGVATGHAPVCAVLFSSGRFLLVPGFTAWVTAHYSEAIGLGGPRVLYVAPGCA